MFDNDSPPATHGPWACSPACFFAPLIGEIQTTIHGVADNVQNMKEAAAGNAKLIDILRKDVQTVKETLIGNGHFEDSVLHRINSLEESRRAGDTASMAAVDKQNKRLTYTQALLLVVFTTILQQAAPYVVPFFMKH